MNVEMFDPESPLEAIPEHPGDTSDTYMTVHWVFRLNKPDALLVLKALGGRIRSEKEAQLAKELGDRLTLVRARVAKDMLAPLIRAAEHVTETEKPE